MSLVVFGLNAIAVPWVPGTLRSLGMLGSGSCGLGNGALFSIQGPGGQNPAQDAPAAS